MESAPTPWSQCSFSFPTTTTPFLDRSYYVILESVRSKLYTTFQLQPQHTFIKPRYHRTCLLNSPAPWADIFTEWSLFCEQLTTFFVQVAIISQSVFATHHAALPSQTSAWMWYYIMIILYYHHSTAWVFQIVQLFGEGMIDFCILWGHPIFQTEIWCAEVYGTT